LPSMRYVYGSCVCVFTLCEEKDERY
jgi:hypothetical protein